ncbi:MAG: TonB-dependent receptor [Colwellia sp.]|nr:TonB-dependent receptor [Colwellia sp.]
MDGKLDLTLGHYYFHQDIEYSEDYYIAGGALKFVLGGLMDHTSYGAFIRTDYHISDKPPISAGARYTIEEKKASIIDSTDGKCTDVGTYICEGKWLDLELEWTSVTPKLGVDYKLKKIPWFMLFGQKVSVAVALTFEMQNCMLHSLI